MIECQVKYVSQLLVLMAEKKLKSVEVTAEAFDAYLNDQQTKLATSVWSRKYCQSWYQTSKGNVFALWASGTWQYWWAVRKPKLNEFLLK